MMPTNYKPRTLDGVFFHLQEFGARGYESIPGIAVLSGKLILWAPSAAIIHSESSAGRLNFSTHDLLRWVDTGLIQIAARHEWLLSKSSRSKGYWQNAPWFDEFDNVIRSWAIEDESIPDMRRRRVVGLNTGNGYLLAKEQLASNTELMKRVDYHISKNSFSSSMIAAAKQNFADYSELHCIDSESNFLRYFFAAWAYNHIEAQNYVASDITFSTEKQALYFQDIVRNLESSFGASPVAPKFESLAAFLKSEFVDEMVEFMHFLLEVRTAKALDNLMSRQNSVRFLREVVLHPTLPPLLRLEAELDETISDLRLRSYAPSSFSVRDEHRFVQLLEELYNGFTVLMGNFSPALLRTKALQTLNIKGVPKYKNHWAFLIAGKANPRKKDLEKMQNWLREFKDKRRER